MSYNNNDGMIEFMVCSLIADGLPREFARILQIDTVEGIAEHQHLSPDQARSLWINLMVDAYRDSISPRPVGINTVPEMN